MCGHHLLNWLFNPLQYAGPYGHLLYFSYGTSMCVCVCVIWKLIKEPKKFCHVVSTDLGAFGLQ